MLSEAMARPPVARVTPAVTDSISASRRLSFPFRVSVFTSVSLPGFESGLGGSDSGHEFCRLDERPPKQRPILVRTDRFCLYLPFIGAEGAGWKAGAVEERGDGIGLPGVAHFLRVRHVRRGDDDGVALNARVGPVELLVIAGDGELAELVAFGHETTVSMAELQADLALAALHFLKRRTLIDDLFVAVGHVDCAARAPIAHREGLRRRPY